MYHITTQYRKGYINFNYNDIKNTTKFICRILKKIFNYFKNSTSDMNTTVSN